MDRVAPWNGTAVPSAEAGSPPIAARDLGAGQVGAAYSGGPTAAGPVVRVVVVAVAMAAIAVTAWRIDWGTLGALDSVHAWTLLLLAALLHLSTVPMKAVAWRSTLQPALGNRHIPLRVIMGPVMVGALLNTVLFGRVGEAARVLLVHSRLNRDGRIAPLPAVIGSAVTESLASTVAWVGIVAAVGVILPLPLSVWWVVVVLAVAWMLIVVAALRNWGVPSDSEVPRGLVRRGLEAVRRVWRSVAHGHRALRRPEVLVPLFAASILGWVTQGVSVYAVLRAFDIGGGWEVAALVLVSVTVAQTVPLLPGNIGVFQAAVALPLVASFGVPAATAVAVGLVLQLVQSGPIVVAGAATLAREGEDVGRLYRAARSFGGADPDRAP